MSGHPLLAGALALAAALPAQADPRIATRFYQPSSVVTLHGRAGIQTTIAFADDERIENIAVGNSAAWQVTPNKRANLLFVKPAGARARTNMTVVTDQHTYLFDLVSAAGAMPVYMLRFSYPEKPKAIVPVALPDSAVTVVQTASAPPPNLPPGPTPADLNFDWRAKGDKALLPARSFDDGRSTFLQWPKDATLPAILVKEANGAEGPVNYTVQGQYIVVEGVPAALILRAGKQMATLMPATPRAPATTQTASVAR